jgi:hypothetical protein
VAAIVGGLTKCKRTPQSVTVGYARDCDCACVRVVWRPSAAEDADINQDGHVDYKEFILMITVLFLMTVGKYV